MTIAPEQDRNVPVGQLIPKTAASGVVTLVASVTICGQRQSLQISKQSQSESSGQNQGIIKEHRRPRHYHYRLWRTPKSPIIKAKSTEPSKQIQGNIKELRRPRKSVPFIHDPFGRRCRYWVVPFHVLPVRLARFWPCRSWTEWLAWNSSSSCCADPSSSMFIH